MSNLAYGTFTITNLSVVTSVDVYYYNSTSSTSLSGGSWQTTTPTWTNGKYIWSKTVTTWEQGVTTQSEPVCITGQKGSTGSTGQSVTSIIEQYALSTSNTTAPTTGWSNTMPPFEANKYYWTRSKITWANPTNTTYTDAVLANGITSANTTANAANTTAAQANQTANTANQTANTANQTANAASQTAAQAASAAAAAQSTANNATSIANGKNTIYYGANFPAGGTYKAGDTFFKQTAEGYIIYKYDTTDNQWVKESLDEQGITQITNAKIANLDGGKINAGTITSLKLSTDAIKSRNYQAGTAPYSAFGTFLDLTQGNIYTPNFGVNNDSLDSIDDGAYIRGSIYAHKGTIGQSSTNYWYIGNYKDYNQVNSAMIKGYGTATIQLGESNTWRLNTNRIHTAWNDDSSANEAYRLHYLTRDSKYWDMGLHVPTAGIDKFIYIRSSKNDTSTANILENLQNSLEDNLDGTNNYWTYRFFVSADGSLYARNIYALEENGSYTLISGSDGAYLLKSGGTITGTLTINSTLQVKGNYLNKNGSALTLQTNLGSTTAGTLTGNTTSAISIGVTGTLPSSNGGTGNTNWNQGGVVYIDGSSPKKLLSTAAGTSGYLLKANGTGAPTWINPATLTVAAATKATQDGDGNVIKTTYLKLSGGNVTGPVSFGDSVSVDDLNAGTLVVTGNASFTNNIQANTINGVVVGSSPKFTDTVTTVTTSGSGNAVTAITASGGKLTVTKGTTFLTSFTQSDPIFTASAAASIKQTDINNWNSKTSNTGTVTSVAASGSGGITISGSPITTSGTLAIGLNLSTAINGLGEGTSAANRNDYAVVQYAGGGTTTTSYHRRKLSNVFAALNSSDITTALGFTPYNATNPNGYTSNPGTVTSVQVQASSPLQSSTNTAQSSSLNTTISFVNQNANVVLAGPSSGSAAVPAFRALVAADIPSLTKSKISDFPTTWALSSVTGADDLKAIEALTGTSGFLKKTAANTWSLDTNTYVTSSGVTSITLTQGTGISIGSSGTAITSTGTRTISLADNYGDTKNPYASKTARYVLAAPAAQAGAPTFRALTKDDVGLNNVLNYAQITAIGQGDNGTLRVWTGDPTSTNTNDYEDIALTITAYSQSTVSKAAALNLSAAVGSTSKPVYFKADGKPYEISYTIEKSVPSNAVFTDTWNKVSTSQDGYITKLPGNTTTFLRGDGTWGTPSGTYSLPLAANGTRGGVQIGYSSSGKNYAVQLSSQKMYVNVPWTDTTYSAGTGLSLSGTTFSNTGVTGIKGNAESSYRTGQVNLTASNVGAVAITGDETVSGNKTFSGIITITPSSNFSSQSGVVSANSSSIIQSPIPKYLWHDIWAFCRASTPKYYTSADGSTWVEGTLEKNLFAHKEAWGESNVLSSSIKGSRWTWLGGGFYASQASWIVLGVTYKNPSAYFDLLLETSSDSGSTWSTMLSVTNLHYVQTPIWIKNSTTCQNSLRLTLTWNNNSASNAVLGLCSIRFLTPRWGDQGKGGEFEYPFVWDGIPNVYPIKDNTSTLGTSSYKWKNIYATTFTGNVSGTASGNITNIQYDSTNAKFIYTKNNLNTDIVTITNLKTYLGLGNVENTALSTWTGTNKITTLGTITTGTWNGTTIAVNKGGTGKTSWTQWGVLYASGTTELVNTAAGTSGYLLQGNGDAAPNWIQATNANTVNTIVKRDGSGNFSAGTITATLSGTSTNATNLMAYSSNEVTFGCNNATVGASTNDTVWINYRDRSGGTTDNNATKIVHYHFGNRKGNVTGVQIHAETFNGALSGNASTATKATQDSSGNVIIDTYLKKAGDSTTGGLAINASNSYSSYNEGLRINAGARTYATLLLGGTNNSTAGTNDGAFWLGVYNTSSYTRRLMIAHNGSTATNTYFYASSASQVSPALHLGTSGTITSGNADAITGGTVYTALSEGYVTLATEQTVSGRKTFSNLAAVTFKPSSGDGLCNINYNSTLNALVFSFV